MTPAPLGFVLTGHDNRAYFFDRSTPPEIFCEKCDSVIDRSYFPAEVLVRTGMDLSSTYDNRDICSRSFVSFCRDRDIPGIDFREFRGQDKEYFFPIVHRVVPFDAKRRGTRFECRCDLCGNFGDVIGARPAYLVRPLPERGFFRSDIEFGSGRAKSPLLIIDSETSKEIEMAILRGVELEPIRP